MVYHNSRRLDRVFAGLADPTRRAILTRLATGDKTISELASRFDMTLPAVSKHIRVLERAGLARVRREGRSRRTHLVAAPLREAVDWIERYRRFWEFQLDQLAAFLEEGVPPSAGSLDEQESTPWQPPRKSKAKRSRSGGPSRRPGSASSARGRRRKS
jgi:DNA-binding transcriptional ArsR family regulator